MDSKIFERRASTSTASTATGRTTTLHVRPRVDGGKTTFLIGENAPARTTYRETFCLRTSRTGLVAVR